MFGYVPPVPRARLPIVWAHAGVAVAPAWRDLVAAGPNESVRRVQRGLILDLDDTLYPRERFVRSGLAAVAQHVSSAHGIPADLAYGVMTRALATGSNGLELQVLRDRFGLPSDVVPRLVEVFRRHTPSLWLGREVADVLRRLRADGWGLVILTNGLPSVQCRKIAALGLASLVDDVVYAEEHAPGGKPSEAPFRAALHSLTLTAGRCVSVGDDPARDTRGARALGMPTIRLARPGIQVDPAADADMVIDALPQLPAAAALLLTTVTANVA